MAAVNTSGFQVQAQPGINYLPASSLVGNLSGILPAASQGAGFVSQLTQIADNARLAPLRQQLQQIQLQDAQNQLDSAPLDRQLKLAQIAHSNRPIERVLGTELKRIPRINSPEDTPAQDENGNYTFEEGDTNYDLTPIQHVEVTDPMTGLTRIENRSLTPIATAETLSDRADKLEIQRLTQESLAGQRENNQRLAEARLNNPEWKRLGYGVNPNTGKQGYLIMNQRTREIQEIPTNMVPVPTGVDALTGAIDKLTGGGKSNIAAPITINALNTAASIVAPEDTPAGPADDETAGLVSDLTKAFTVPTSSQSQSAFSTLNEAKAAAAAGRLKKGDKITVGGVRGTWQ